MENRDLKRLATIVVETLHQEKSGMPESMLYMALGMDMAKAMTIKDLLIASKLVTCRHNYIELAPQGIKYGEWIAAQRAKQCEATV